MDDDTFWRLISTLDWRHEGADDKVVEPVVHGLSQMDEQDIFGFQETLARLLYALDGRAWARESGGTVWWGEPSSLSVDAFLYTRCVVIANGRTFYETALADPRAMPKDMEFESLLYVAPTAWEARTATEWDHQTALSFETFSNQSQWA